MIPFIIAGAGAATATIYSAKKIYDWATDNEYDEDEYDEDEEEEDQQREKKQLAAVRKSVREYVADRAGSENINTKCLKVAKWTQRKRGAYEKSLTPKSIEILDLHSPTNYSLTYVDYDSKNDDSYKRKEIKKLKKEIAEVDNLLETEFFGLTSYFDIQIGNKRK